MPTVKKDTVSSKSVILDEKDIQIEELQKKIEELTAMVQSVQNKSESKKVDVEEYKEPDPNKQIRIISLYFGELNLSTEPYGKGKLLSFSKYGETKTILYSTLIDIVNNNRKFAESGIFYILDKDATYYLGLSENYKNLLSKDIIDKIYDYSPSEITDLISNATEDQKYAIIQSIVNKLYNGKKIDLNKCDVIGKCCGVNISEKVEEMKKFDKNNSD